MHAYHEAEDARAWPHEEPFPIRRAMFATEPVYQRYRAAPWFAAMLARRWLAWRIRNRWKALWRRAE